MLTDIIEHAPQPLENLLTYSEQIDHVSWAKSNVSVDANAILAPDGTLTADKLIEDVTHNIHRVFKGATGVGAGEISTGSFHVKEGERNKVRLVLYDGIQIYADVSFDLTTATMFDIDFGSGTIEDIDDDGWYRITVTGSTVTGTEARLLFYILNEFSSVTYTGDGVSGVYHWGAQVAKGSVPLDYSKTEDVIVELQSSGGDIVMDMKE